MWVADQLVLDRRVAIKLLSAEIIESEVGRELFEREARATARVDHPHVVRVVDFAVTDAGVPFLVLELLAGETLEERLLRSGPLAPADVRTMLAQTADALDFAHQSGILHRDIKAENIFLRRRALPELIDVKLLDFGVALHRARPMVHALGIVGTPAYMPPEQLTGAEIDERCDLFSLGVVAYYALTGEFPYRGETVEEIACSLAHGAYVPVTQLRRELPAALDAWFVRAIATNADERFVSASEMMAAFERALEAPRETPVAHAASMPSITVERVSRQSARGVRAALIGVVAAIALTAGYAKLGSVRSAIARAEPRAAAAAPSVAVAQPVASAARTSTEAAPPPPPTQIAAFVPAATSRVEPERPKRRAAHTPDAGADALAAQEPLEQTVDAAAPDAEDVIEGTEGFGNRQ